MGNIIIETDDEYFNADFYCYDKQSHKLIFHSPLELFSRKTIKNVVCETKIDNNKVYIRATHINSRK